MKKDKKIQPFGLNLLSEIPAKELEQINGGFRFGGFGGGHLHTNYISMPQKAFPRGDHG